MVGAGILLVLAPAVSLAQDAAAQKPAPKARSAAPPGSAKPADANADARRLEQERYKRWDDRMRRATRSLCDRC
jgi:hypothetical protein